MNSVTYVKMSQGTEVFVSASSRTMNTITVIANNLKGSRTQRTRVWNTNHINTSFLNSHFNIKKIFSAQLWKTSAVFF